MNDKVSDLLGIIRDEIQLYRDLLEHARKKTSLLVHGSAEAILESNKFEEALSGKLRGLEQEMMRVCGDLGQTYRIPSSELTLMKLAENLEHSLCQELKSQAALFGNLVGQLKSVTQRNRRLAERAVHYSSGILALFSNLWGAYRQSGTLDVVPAIRPTFSQRV